jgi:hypothetical protein
VTSFVVAVVVPVVVPKGSVSLVLLPVLNLGSSVGGLCGRNRGDDSSVGGGVLFGWLGCGRKMSNFGGIGCGAGAGGSGIRVLGKGFAKSVLGRSGSVSGISSVGSCGSEGTAVGSDTTKKGNGIVSTCAIGVERKMLVESVGVRSSNPAGALFDEGNRKKQVRSACEKTSKDLGEADSVGSVGCAEGGRGGRSVVAVKRRGSGSLDFAEKTEGEGSVDGTRILVPFVLRKLWIESQGERDSMNLLSLGQLLGRIAVLRSCQSEPLLLFHSLVVSLLLVPSLLLHSRFEHVERMEGGSVQAHLKAATCCLSFVTLEDFEKVLLVESLKSKSRLSSEKLTP